MVLGLLNADIQMDGQADRSGEVSRRIIVVFDRE
jgi:hypothetical protein